ncbi:MAG: glycosyltransferase family 4 protein [Planctomycetaceae bacterium]|jgi:colanic acid biosynthesis glycosyl transferase WcaI|nr:glycosyltransferase family 4 protein [Planctomycetaceae bacterium]MBT6153732.1 glycosyltransferase family 4 protein [Planctomycetaceae bacterium]MBT6485527.1 glycosyltransferase family 4 protein [Planctomycetaceae bacterium]MBT6494413.1 glycosyltransferase family 4 protein [Planctomycetaceae bacterium]
MHIVFLTHYFPPEVNAPATRTFEHCKRWASAGHDVTVITSAPNCPTGIVFDGYRNAWRAEELVDGMKVIRTWTYLSANAGFLKRILNYVSFMLTATWVAVRLRKVDVVVATSPQFFCGWAGVLCHWIRRWPFVLEVRDIWPESIVNVGAMKRSPLIRILEWLEKRMYAAADHIVTVGEGYRRQLLDRGVAEQKISVVTNGIDCREFLQPTDQTSYRRNWNAEEKFVCAYVGTIGMAHGLEVVLQAAELLKRQERDDIQFWMVGDGASREKLEDDAKGRQLENVRFSGLLSKERIARLIANSDACLVHLRDSPLFQTVIPSKIFEAMALNIPIILGLRGETQRIVSDARAGVVMVPEDPQSLIDCIETINRDDQAYRHGRAFVADHFDRNQLAGRMLDVLIDVAAGRQPSESGVHAVGDELPSDDWTRRAA